MIRQLRLRLRALLLALSLLGLSALAVYAQIGGDFDLRWFSVDGGGATFSSGGPYQLGGTIGQHDVAPMAGGEFELSGGFWPGAVRRASTASPTATVTSTPSATPTNTATPTGTPSATATATDTPSGTPTNTATPTPTASNTAPPTATAGATATPGGPVPPPAPCYPVEWLPAHAVGVIYSSGVITKTSAAGWTGGAISQQALAGPAAAGQRGAVQLQVTSSASYFSFGLSFAGATGYGDAGQSYSDIDFAFYAYPPTGLLQVRQRGVVVKNIGRYAVGDLLRVEHAGSQVQFYHNNLLVYTAAATLTDGSFPLALDSALYSQGSSLHDVQICGSNLIDLPTAQLTTTPLPSEPTATPTLPGNSFSDVHPGDYFYFAVAYLHSRGCISGYGDGTYRPTAAITRGQLTKVLVLAAGMRLVNPAQPTFRDVPPDDPFYTYVETAATLNVVTGYEDGTFRPYANLTRGQLTKLIVLGMAIPLAEGGATHFQDVPPSNPFYIYVETAYQLGLVSGYGDMRFRPDNSATRGQIAKIIYNAATILR